MKNYSFLVSCLILNLTSCANEGPITFLDYPRDLSSEIDTIEVFYVQWACACANWWPVNDVKRGGAIREEDCIFIEPARPELTIPDAYRIGVDGNKIRLIGRYYRDEGIARAYESPTPERPKYGRVFRYHIVEVVKPYTIWDFDQDGAETMVLAVDDKTFNEE